MAGVKDQCVYQFHHYPIWLLRWDLNPRSSGYEPDEITTSPLSDIMVGKVGFEPTNITYFYLIEGYVILYDNWHKLLYTFPFHLLSFVY